MITIISEDVFKSHELRDALTGIKSIVDVVTPLEALTQNYGDICFVMDAHMERFNWIDYYEILKFQNKNSAIVLLHDDGDETELEIIQRDIRFHTHRDANIDLIKAYVLKAVTECDSLKKTRNSGYEPIRYLDNDLEINNLTNTIQRGKQMVSLTAIEKEILLLLIDAKENIVTRQEVMETLYPEKRDDESVNHRFVDVHIKNIRDKLGRDSIRTVRGRGYFINLNAILG
ncbi:winged helix-turn-helix transcriptional regulator [Erysipelothrix sp. HDW6B]|uniref:winged helix-turn-helix domain-containing protein n=1 Tax=Erysipelothrix TaxID=1647 RepID=UPI0013583B56|nr:MULTISPECIES: winged helix-turn-helix domain-containing protein [Erysipelothrix]QIK86501.1 winged helix-turn-helix transcriptional regulator [Erysipelothrix sp. HDW6B]